MLTKIVRQQIDALRQAVFDLSQGRTEAGFDKLNNFGAVHEIENRAERVATIAQAHLAACKEGKSSLIVAPTHFECRSIADAVRDQQKKEGLLGAEDQTITRLGKLNLTESLRRDLINYEVGQVVEFHRRARGGFKSGERWEVARRSSQAVELVKEGRAKLLAISSGQELRPLYMRGDHLGGRRHDSDHQKLPSRRLPVQKQRIVHYKGYRR